MRPINWSFFRRVLVVTWIHTECKTALIAAFHTCSAAIPWGRLQRSILLPMMLQIWRIRFVSRLHTSAVRRLPSPLPPRPPGSHCFSSTLLGPVRSSCSVPTANVSDLHLCFPSQRLPAHWYPSKLALSQPFHFTELYSLFITSARDGFWPSPFGWLRGKDHPFHLDLYRQDRLPFC